MGVCKGVEVGVGLCCDGVWECGDGCGGEHRDEFLSLRGGLVVGRA